MGHVEQIKKLHLVSQLPDGRGRTVLHVAAKYGKFSAVRYILRHLEVGKHINAVDHAGNTPLHLAAMHSQPRALTLLLLDNRIQVTVTNNKCLTALDIARECITRKHAFRNDSVYWLLQGHPIQKGRTLDGDSLIHRPKALDKRFVCSGRNIKSRDIVRDLINSRMVVATLVATVTFAAGFAVPGGFNGSDAASKDDRGMATMLDNRQFQVFVIFNTFAMFSSIAALSILIWERLDEVDSSVSAFKATTQPLQWAIVTMSVAFYTGVASTVSKLPWLVNIITLIGFLFLFFSVSRMLTASATSLVLSIPTCRRTVLLALAYFFMRSVDASIDDDAEEDGTTSETSASRPTDGAGQSKTDDSATAKCGDAPHPPSH
ncbi:protein ACCELERATED CELL DEATH 6-like isoform X1 [Eucalyptus grandis]|uniref:protein ACCELERATED CELL DEATH 6-like isoform X1 n=1 Tax=Eucalyptus grandis TaxID=71139 RepID=UPI00192F0F69|nr:protein ACCELERATED CELL DEATH 6-like isoform X1 [Eucalyptus grandis]